MSKYGICKLCCQEKDLQLSHAISNSIFKKLSRGSSGKSIYCPVTEPDNIHYTSDSWATYQLCFDCEQYLNNEYEKYSLEVLRGKNCIFEKTNTCLAFYEINQQKLIMFFLSIYWRAAKSDCYEYQNVIITEQIDDYLRDCILNNRVVSSVVCYIKLVRLINLSVTSTLSDDDIKKLVASPFARRENLSFVFIFEGFLIEVFFNELIFKNKKGILNVGKTWLFVPWQDIFEVKEISKSFNEIRRKHFNGNTLLKI